MSEITREAWLELRRKGITGTDISAILNINPWKNAHEVWLEKIGEAPEKPVNDSMLWGTYLEPVIAGHYEKTHGVKLNKGEFISKGIFCGTPDYYDPTTEAVIEIKTTNAFNAKDWSEDVPDYYRVQGAWYTMLTGCKQCTFVCLIGGQKYIERTYPRDEVLEQHCAKHAQRFWSTYVETRTPPPIISEIKQETKEILEAKDPEIDQAGKRLKQLKRLRDELETEEKILRQTVQAFIGSAYGIKGDGWKALWTTTQGRESLDKDSLFADPEFPKHLIQKHTKQGLPYRTFRLS